MRVASQQRAGHSALSRCRGNTTSRGQLHHLTFLQRCAVLEARDSCALPHASREPASEKTGESEHAACKPLQVAESASLVRRNGISQFSPFSVARSHALSWGVRKCLYHSNSVVHCERLCVLPVSPTHDDIRYFLKMIC